MRGVAILSAEAGGYTVLWAWGLFQSTSGNVKRFTRKGKPKEGGKGLSKV